MDTTKEDIVVRVTPEERAAFGALAERLGVSIGELFRRAAQAYEPVPSEPEWESLLDTLIATMDRAVQSVDKTVENCEKSNERRAALEQARR